MALNFSPKVGEVVECYFGDFPNPVPPRPAEFDTVMSPEIRKRRMCVILNARLPNSCILVVPISSSDNPNALQRGVHVYLPPALFHITPFYDTRDRWAIAECVTHVSRERLFPIQRNKATLHPLTLSAKDPLSAEISRTAVESSLRSDPAHPESRTGHCRRSRRRPFRCRRPQPAPESDSRAAGPAFLHGRASAGSNHHGRSSEWTPPASAAAPRPGRRCLPGSGGTRGSVSYEPLGGMIREAIGQRCNGAPQLGAVTQGEALIGLLRGDSRQGTKWP